MVDEINKQKELRIVIDTPVNKIFVNDEDVGAPLPEYCLYWMLAERYITHDRDKPASRFLKLTGLDPEAVLTEFKEFVEKKGLYSSDPVSPDSCRGRRTKKIHPHQVKVKYIRNRISEFGKKMEQLAEQMQMPKELLSILGVTNYWGFSLDVSPDSIQILK